MSRIALLAAALALVVLAPIALPAAPAARADPGTATHPYVVQPFSVQVGGQTATGWLAYPTDAPPTTLLVYAHGCCGYLGSGDFLAGYAAYYGAAAVGMSYRGNGHWNVMTGHLDTNAATEAVKARFPSIQRTIIWGISMGGEVSGMAVAARPDLYDYWVDTFGVTDLFQEFLALGFYPGIGLNANNPTNPTSSWILEETGGLPGIAPLSAWTDRSPDLLTASMKGLKHAYLNHGVGDMIVYPTETAATFAGLQAAGVPATLCLAATGYGGTTVNPADGALGGLGFVNVPYSLPYLVPGLPAIPVPVPGLAGHDGRGFACSGAQVDALLRGRVPDDGAPAAVYLMDFTAGVYVGTTIPPKLPALPP